ncbi:alpha/beta hydrolase [Bacteroides sp. 214]|uniref:alpha/beta hydrolase n=1 Tax=Bacteroides sp. 214 TaxID=2302935 RepID=UPI0013D532CE|nr:alpha/beta hydrolase [Bacteroides sp. 214]NDW12987.1 alpha/beta hydrolase [Bacteroides sp. 214]
MNKLPSLLPTLIGFLLVCAPAMAQQELPLWNKNMPNSKGIPTKNIIANERITQVGTPYIQVFEPSKAERTGTAVLIIPGGGYVRLAHEISGIALAKWYNTMGVTAFVLAHRFPQSPDVVTCYKAPLQDAQRAMRYIRANAATYGIDTNKVGVMGCSAGGHLAASLCVLKEDWSAAGDSLDAYSYTPSFAVLISPVISMDDAMVHKGSRSNLLGEYEKEETIRTLFSLEKQVAADTPPALLIHASNDRSVSPLNSLAFYTSLQQHKVLKSSVHIFPDGGHAISLRKQPGTTIFWSELAEKWMIEIGALIPL